MEVNGDSLGRGPDQQETDMRRGGSRLLSGALDCKMLAFSSIFADEDRCRVEGHGKVGAAQAGKVEKNPGRGGKEANSIVSAVSGKWKVYWTSRHDSWI